jgi:hypothetical protein
MSNQFIFEESTSKNLKHYGIVSSIIEDLKIVEKNRQKKFHKNVTALGNGILEDN